MLMFVVECLSRGKYRILHCVMGCSWLLARHGPGVIGRSESCGGPTDVPDSDTLLSTSGRGWPVDRMKQCWCSHCDHENSGDALPCHGGPGPTYSVTAACRIATNVAAAGAYLHSKAGSILTVW